MKADNKSILKKAFTATLPIMAGYLVLGLGFGIILKSKGYGAIWAFAMSTVIYAGSMQYLAIDLICGGAGLLTTALTTLMVNARHLFYGISMVDKFKNAGKAKPYLIYALSDETYSLVCVDMDMEEGERNKFCPSLSSAESRRPRLILSIWEKYCPMRLWACWSSAV